MKFNMRNLLIGVVIIIVLAVIFLRGDQLVEVAETMKKGAMLPLVIAILTQLGKYFAQSFGYSFAFESVGEYMNPRNTLPLVFGTFFMNTVAPSLNLAGTTLIVDDARRRGINPGKATSAALFMQITIDGAFICVMMIGFLILALSVGLSPLWFALGSVVVLLVAAMVTIMFLGYKKPELLTGILTRVETLVNNVRAKMNKPPMAPWVDKIVESFGLAAYTIAHSPKSALKTFGCSLVASSCELACFSLVGFAFGVSTVQALICGYVVATLFAMVSFTPQGVGVVEAAVTVAFTGFGETAAAGMAIGLIYRSIVFWMPFLIGAVLIQFTNTFRGEKKKPAVAAPKTEAGEAVDEKAAAEAAARAVPVPNAVSTAFEVREIETPGDAPNIKVTPSPIDESIRLLRAYDFQDENTPNPDGPVEIIHYAHKSKRTREREAAEAVKAAQAADAVEAAEAAAAVEVAAGDVQVTVEAAQATLPVEVEAVVEVIE